jgi:hypothetical protein
MLRFGRESGISSTFWFCCVWGMSECGEVLCWAVREQQRARAGMQRRARGRDVIAFPFFAGLATMRIV